MKIRTIFSIIVLVAFAVTEGRAQELTGFSEKGKWGFKDAQGAVVVKPVYDTVYSFSDGMARVRNKSGKKHVYGYVNAAGKEVIKPKYIAATDFEDGVAIVSEGMVSLDWKAEMRAAGAQMMGSAAQIATASLGITKAAHGMSNQTEQAEINRLFTEGNLQYARQLNRLEQRNTELLQQIGSDNQPDPNTLSTPGFVILDKTGRELVSQKAKCVLFVKVDAMPSNRYLMTAYAGRPDWGGVPLFFYGIYDADKKQETIPVQYTRFDMETFAEKDRIVVAAFKNVTTKHYYGVVDYSGKFIIPAEHEIFDAAVFAPHERILAGDILKRHMPLISKVEDIPTIERASYGVLDYSGKVIIPKIECQGIELADNMFVMTDTKGAKRYFDLDGKEIKK